MTHCSASTSGSLRPSSIKSCTVAKPLALAPGTSRMKILSRGMPLLSAAFRAFSSKGAQVKSAVALDDLSWCSSSSAEYAALAGVTIPDRRWTAWVSGM